MLSADNFVKKIWTTSADSAIVIPPRQRISTTYVLVVPLPFIDKLFLTKTNTVLNQKVPSKMEHL